MIDYKKEFNGKNVLITGGAGFIGSNLAHRLSELGANITIIDAMIPSLGGLHHNVKELVSNAKIFLGEAGNIKNIRQIKGYLAGKDFVFNVAGSIRHTPSTEDDLMFDSDINFTAHTLFLEACRQHIIENNHSISIVFTGTRDQYGKVPSIDLPVSENYIPGQFTDYQSISKRAAEYHHMMLHSALLDKGIKNAKICSARLTNTYGPRQLLNCGAVVPTFIKKAILGETIEIWGGGNVLRDFNYIDDVVEALLLLASSPYTGGQAYNLGCCIGKEGMNTPIGENLVTIKNLAYKINSILGAGKIEEREYPGDRASIEPGHCCSDISKIARIGWIPRISLNEGLKRTIEFYKANQEAYLK